MSSSNLTQTDIMTLQTLLAKLSCNGTSTSAKSNVNSTMQNSTRNNPPLALHTAPYGPSLNYATFNSPSPNYATFNSPPGFNSPPQAQLVYYLPAHSVYYPPVQFYSQPSQSGQPVQDFAMGKWNMDTGASSHLNDFVSSLSDVFNLGIYRNCKDMASEEEDYRPKVVVNAVKGNNVNVIKASACWVWKTKTKVLDHVSKHNSASITLKKFDYIDVQGRSKSDQGVIDSGCLSHMIGNMSYLTDYEEIDGGYVAFGGNPKGGKITGKDTIKTVTRTPQQNGVAERRNRTLIKAARTMLADSKLPTTFWAEVVNTACYVQNRVLVVKPHNKTPYELFHGRTPTLSFMRPFGCPVTILNTIDHLGKFDGKADEGFFVGYSLNSKAFRVFNSRTRIVEENLHIRFSESTPNVVGSGLDWLFDIDALTRTMNYEPIVAGTQSNGFADTKASDNAGQARKETKPVKNYILLPLWPADPPYSQDPKSSQDDGSKPSSDDGKKVDEDPRKDSECNDQEKEDNVNSTNNVNAASTNEVNVVGGKTSIELPLDPNMPELEDYSIFEDDEDVGAEADMHNLDTTIQVSPIPTTRIHKDHPLDQVIGDLQSATQTRRMSKSLEEHGFVSTIQQRTNHKDLQNCLFACFLSQEEPKKVIHALKDPSWIEAMQEELLQFKLQEVWTLVDLPYGKRAICTKWVFKNKKN
ncbi:putative ribonuclease H-like domain-containing protein [Tanacetum coccineum]